MSFMRYIQIDAGPRVSFKQNPTDNWGIGGSVLTDIVQARASE